MKKALFLFSVLVLPVAAFAYNPVPIEPEAPYEPVIIEGDIYVERNILGELEGSPDLLEFSSDVAFTVTAALKQKNTKSPKPFGLLLVRQNDNDGGVTEVVRQNVDPSEWRVSRIFSLGMTFLEGPQLKRDLPPGTYRLEINTAENYGDYMLVLGDEEVRSGFWSRFAAVFITQHHFGVFFPFAFLSPYVSVPILILLTIFIWFKRKWDKVHI